MRAIQVSILTAFALAAVGCGPQPGAAALYLSTDVATFDGRTQHAVLRVQAFQASGEPGQGVVSLLAPAGTFSGGNELTLVDGFGTASFVCDPAADTACSGSVRLSASWAAQTAALVVRVTPATVATPVRWKALPTGTLATLNALAVADARTVWAVGTGGAVQRLTDSTWEGVASGTLDSLLAVTVTGDGTAIAAGEHGALLRWSGGAFQALPGDIKESYTSVAGLGATDFVVGTASGHLLHWDGLALTDEADLGSPVLSLAVQAGEVWAGGVGAFAVRQAGAWTVQTAPVLARYSIATSSPEGLYLGGTRMDATGGVLFLGPADWRTQALSDEATAMAVVPQSEERFAVTARGVVRAEGTGSSWRQVEAPMGGRAAASRSPGDLVVVGAPGLSIVRVP
jgi:hypothetical protein